MINTAVGNDDEDGALDASAADIEGGGEEGQDDELEEES